MKKLLLLTVAILGVTILMANPLLMPSITLSELFFDSNGKWVIELQFSDARQEFGQYSKIDSIWVKSSSGISAVKRFKIVGTTGVIVVRNDSLLNDLAINSKGDAVEILYSFESAKFSKGVVIFGNIKNATVASPRVGQSIAGIPPYFSYTGKYSLDKSPTIGSMNTDTLGMCGTLKGHIYDRHNHLLSKAIGWYYTDGIEFNLNSKIDGTYSARLCSKKNYADKLYLINEQVYARITPIEFSMQPDSVISMDIHLLDSITVSNEKIYTNSELLFKLFPNPITDLAVNYEINIPVKSSNCYLELINVNGQKIARFVITENKGRITLPTTIKSGTYSILLMFNNKNYGSSKVIINR